MRARRARPMAGTRRFPKKFELGTKVIGVRVGALHVRKRGSPVTQKGRPASQRPSAGACDPLCRTLGMAKLSSSTIASFPRFARRRRALFRTQGAGRGTGKGTQGCRQTELAALASSVALRRGDTSPSGLACHVVCSTSSVRLQL